MKKIIFITILTLLSTINLFADFEFSINAPLYFSYTFPSISGKSSGINIYTGKNDIEPPNGGINIGTGALMQIGGSFNLNNDTIPSLSLVADIGYYLQSYKLNQTFDYVYLDSSREKFIFLHTFNLGFLFKINAANPNNRPFSICMGGGLRLPLSGLIGTIYDDDTENTEHLSYSDIRKSYEYLFIPYVKLLLESYFYTSKRTAFVLGTYITYSFPLKYDVETINANPKNSLNKVYKFEVSSLDIGFSLGFYFGRENRKPTNTDTNQTMGTSLSEDNMQH